MTGFLAQYNRGRAEKIAAMLVHMQTSARSNKATPDEIANVLSPVFDKLGEMGIASAVIAATLPSETIPAPTIPAEATAPQARIKTSPTRGESIDRFLDGMSTDQLLDVLYLTTTRIDQTLRTTGA